MHFQRHDEFHSDIFNMQVVNFSHLYLLHFLCCLTLLIILQWVNSYTILHQSARANGNSFCLPKGVAFSVVPDWNLCLDKAENSCIHSYRNRAGKHHKQHMYQEYLKNSMVLNCHGNVTGNEEFYDNITITINIITMTPIIGVIQIIPWYQVIK